MSEHWLISVPVWGDKYRQTFETYAMPALRAALDGFEPVRFVIHTDKPDWAKQVVSPLACDAIQIPQGSAYVALQNAHSDAIRRATLRQRVVLLNADLIVSKNLFSSCAAHISAGKKAIVTTGIRTNLDGQAPPVGANPRELLLWAWSHRHNIIKDLEWGTGGSMLPTNLFFVRSGSVILHGFHLHPVAILKEAQLSFKSTIDGDLLDKFLGSEIHVVTSPDDLSMLEMSDPTRRFPVSGIMDERRVAGAMLSRASSMHRWLFTHRMVMVGKPEEEWEMPTVNKILRFMESMRPQKGIPL